MIASVKKNFYAVMLLLIMVFLVISFSFTLYNKNVLVKYTQTKEQTKMLSDELDKIFNRTLNRMDLGLRGYYMTKDVQLLNPYTIALDEHKVNMRKIDSLLLIQGNESHISEFSSFKEHLNGYLKHCDKMRSLVYQGDDSGFMALLAQDKGYDLWQKFKPFSDRINAYQEKLASEAQHTFEASLNSNALIQVIILLFGVPTMSFLIVRLRKEEKNRNALLRNFKKNNDRFVFTTGEDSEEIDAENIIKTSTENIRQASAFVEKITKGEYDIEWQGMSADNELLNKDNLSGHLIKMRDEMKRVKKLDQERLWQTEGLAKFSDVVRNNQDSIAKLCDSAVRFLTTYIEAQQGSLFLLVEEESNRYLKLTSCYAFDKKKYMEKNIPIGSGLVGQTFLEGKVCLLTAVPHGYVTITSGLGEATPNCLVIVPMMHNEKVACVFEVASFKKYESYHIEFLERAGEIVASAISGVQINEGTSSLLEQAKVNMEMMRAQEEEMQQNMEELQATQEEMARKEKENHKLLDEYKSREKELLNKIQFLEQKSMVSN